MYCQSCGKEVNSGLSFCNFCGFRLNEPKHDPGALTQTSFNLLVGAAVGIPEIGLGIIIAIMAVMKNGLGFHDDMIAGVILLTFLLLFIAEIGMLFMMISRTKKQKAPQESVSIDSKPVHAIDDGVFKGLNASSFDGVPSVTEHTTRTLDAVYRKTGDGN